MIVDHIKYAFPNCLNFFTEYFGRIAFPLFAFGIVQGYKHTRDLKRYIRRLMIAGIISQIPYSLFTSLPTLNSVALNVNFTFILGLLAIVIYEKTENKLKGLLYVLSIGILGNITLTDYGLFGIILIFSFYVFSESKLKTFFAGVVVISMKYLFRIFYYGKGVFSEYYVVNWICTLISLFIILLYNGKKGKGFKWFFYLFYPLHLLIFYLASPLTS